MPESMIEQLFVAKDEWWSAPEKTVEHFSHWGGLPKYCIEALGVSLADAANNTVDGKGEKLDMHGERIPDAHRRYMERRSLLLGEQFLKAGGSSRSSGTIGGGDDATAFPRWLRHDKQ